MIFKRNLATSGICFAWLPVKTPEGIVWLEHVHFLWVPSWGWGSSDYYRYTRMLSEDAYNRGERAQSSFKAYATPPGDPKAFCNKYNPDGPTPCHWPNCKWRDENGVESCGADRIAECQR